MNPEDPLSEEPMSPTALQDSSAPLVRMIRAAHTAGVDLKLDAKAAGDIADCIETFARLADQGREGVLKLGAQLRQTQAELEYFEHGYQWAKALIIQSQKPK